jgi:hypothetical protein
MSTTVSPRASGDATAALVLAALTMLFALRVAGQALVAFAEVTWLPPMEAWFSGLLPYPILLPAQLVILAAQLALDWRVWRCGLAARPRVAAALRRSSYVYALAMLVRLVVTRAHVIPVVFHWVLAAYLYSLAGVSAGRTPRAAGR